MKTPVTAQTLHTLADGYAGRAIDSGLERITEDLQNRDNDGKTRTLTIKIAFTPEGDRTTIDVDVGVKIPGYKPPKTIAKMDDRAGGLVFSPDRSVNPDQMPLPGAGVEDDE